VQLQENPQYELDEAKHALQKAIELDKDSPAASIELGHYLDSVEDDPQAAIKAYGDGVATARRLLIDGLIGQAKAFKQLEKSDEFIHCLTEVLHLIHFDSRSKRNKAEVQEILSELTSNGHAESISRRS
jgi:lipopolysaccharide biosynthesis regulator YciM